MSKASGWITGNTGEFSEPYVVAKLLIDGQVPVVNRNNQLSGAVIPIVGIRREEKAGRVVYIQREDDCYRCVVNDSEQSVRSYEELQRLAADLLDDIRVKKPSPDGKIGAKAFYCPSAEGLLAALSFAVLKAKSDDKSDLKMNIKDPFSVSGYREAGFSIKSRLGGAASLANSGATVFRYDIFCDATSSFSDMSHSEYSGKDLVRKLISLPGFRYEYRGVENSVYRENLRMIDSLFEPMIAAALFHSYHIVGGNFTSVIKDPMFISDVRSICQRDDNGEFFTHKFKDFLKQSALGMQPSKQWLGSNEVTGGALIVRSDGQVVCLCTDKDSDFRDYLFDECHFDTPSSGEGEEKLCSIHQDDSGKYFIRLSLQVRFRKVRKKRAIDR